MKNATYFIFTTLRADYIISIWIKYKTIIAISLLITKSISNHHKNRREPNGVLWILIRWSTLLLLQNC